jgi:chromosome segregation ATPase
MKLSFKLGSNTILAVLFILAVLCLICNIWTLNPMGICASLGFGIFVALYIVRLSDMQNDKDKIYMLTKNYNHINLKYGEVKKALDKAKADISKLEKSIQFEHSNNGILKDDLAQYKTKLDESVNMIDKLTDKAKALKDENEKLIEENSTLKENVAAFLADNNTDSCASIEKTIIEDSSTNIDKSTIVTVSVSDDVLPVEALPLEEVVEKPKKTTKRKKTTKK